MDDLYKHGDMSIALRCSIPPTFQSQLSPSSPDQYEDEDDENVMDDAEIYGDYE